MMAQLHVDIVSAEGQIHHGEAAMVFAPASQGDVGIAPRHAPLLTTMKPGEVRVQTPGGDEPQDDSSAQHGTPNSPSPSPSSSDPAQESLNWAGYVRTGGVAAFDSISGSWVVPDVQCGAGNQNSSAWLGIGGGNGVDPT